MGESGAMKPSAVSSKKNALAPFVILMTAYLTLNSILNLSNKYALVRIFLLFPFVVETSWGDERALVTWEREGWRDSTEPVREEREDV